MTTGRLACRDVFGGHGWTSVMAAGPWCRGSLVGHACLLPSGRAHDGFF